MNDDDDFYFYMDNLGPKGSRPIPLEEMNQFFLDVHTGKICVNYVRGTSAKGMPEWVASNGWRVCVFDDAGYWDYVEWIDDGAGRRSLYGDLYDADRLRSVGPDDDDDITHIWRWDELATLDRMAAARARRFARGT